MAVNEKNKSAPGKEFEGRHLVIGANVAISIVVAVAIAGLIQWGAYYKSAKADMTDTGVNSLSAGTEQLLGDLDEKVRITSLYFATDLEEEDQSKYRTKVNDLLSLLQSENHSMIEQDHFNPLHDHAKREQCFERLRKLEKFEQQFQPYRAFIEEFRTDLAGQIGEAINSELNQTLALADATPEQSEKDELGQIQQLLERWQRELGLTLKDIEAAVDAPQPQYGKAQSFISGLGMNLARDLNSVVTFARQRVQRNTELTPDVRAYLEGANDRLRPIINEMDTITDTVQDLPELEYEQLAAQLGNTSNAIVVETEKDAKVLSFSEVWPPLDPSMGPGAGFGQRLFKGEQKVTSAILQLTVEEKSAVVFVRFAGDPMFASMPQAMRPPPYAKLKELLEETNFTVHEWDISSADAPPEIEPAPVRTIFVVMRPMQPQQNPFQQQQQPPPSFGPEHEAKLLTAMGDDSRAIFFGGWAPGPFGAFPDQYPLNDYLSDNWGLQITSDRLILKALMGERAGEYMLAQQSLYVRDVNKADHILTSGLSGQPMTFSFASPLEMSSDPPEGVTLDKLLWCENSDGLWGVKDVQKYVEQTKNMQGIKREPGDVEGPFNIAAAAQKDEAKIVVVSSRSWMMDAIALAPQLVMTAEGFSLRQSNPGNVHVFLNALHWLNDNTEWMDVGKPVNTGTIEIDEGPALTFVRTFAYGIWPAVALLCGGAAWWVRRR